VKPNEWPTTEATVYSCGWEGTPIDGMLSRKLSGAFSGHFVTVFSYEVNGNHYTGEFSASREWEEGSKFPLRYNPDNPDENNRNDELDSPAVSAATFIAGLALAALFIWWKSRK
jgi:hypothetical protein